MDFTRVSLLYFLPLFLSENMVWEITDTQIGWKFSSVHMFSLETKIVILYAYNGGKFPQYH